MTSLLSTCYSQHSPMEEKSICTTTSSALQNGNNWLHGSHRAPDPQFLPGTFFFQIVSKFIPEHQIHPRASCDHCYHSKHFNLLSEGCKRRYKPFSAQKVHFGHKGHFSSRFRSEMYFLQNFPICSPKPGEQSYMLSTFIWPLQAELQGFKVGTRHKTKLR